VAAICANKDVYIMFASILTKLLRMNDEETSMLSGCAELFVTNIPLREMNKRHYEYEQRTTIVFSSASCCRAVNVSVTRL